MMKKKIGFLGISLAMMVALALSVSAAGDILNPLSVEMDHQSQVMVEYCVFEVESGNETFQINVIPICRDVDGLSGCNGFDILDPPEFSVSPLVQDLVLVDGAGCVELMLTTNLEENETATFYYTVNGNLGGVGVTAETGSVVVVPEFGVAAALIVLASAGLFILRKRK